MIQREADFTATKHVSSAPNASSSSTTTTTTTTSWSRLKDPRIVRVSRAFGGKDRHSKVCTVKGLRDRRVRLSVPTAIQLYDLQERLGLNQPSKVVDWLLNAAKHEIDELPPLQIPTFVQDLTSNSHLVSSDKRGLKISSGFNWNGSTKDLSGETSHGHYRNEEERNTQFENRGELFTSLPSSSLMMNNNYTSPPLLRWDPSNLTLSHPPISGLGSTHDHQDLQNLNPFQFPSSSSRSHHHPQVLVYQPAGLMATQPYLNAEFDDQKQPHFRTSSEFPNSCFNNSSSSSVYDKSTTTQLPVMMRPFYFNSMSTTTANLLLSQANDNNDGSSEQNEGNNDCDDHPHNSPRL